MTVNVSYDIPMEGWKKFVLLTLEYHNMVKKDFKDHRCKFQLYK